MPNKRVEKLAQRFAEVWFVARNVETKALDRMEITDMPMTWDELPERYKNLFRKFASLVEEEFVPGTEHEELVGAFRKEVKFWKEKYAELT